MKVVQELLGDGSAQIAMDVYAQAVTPAKRKAQGKVVCPRRSGVSNKSLGSWGPYR